MAMQTVLIMALPVLYAIPLTVYLLVGAPIRWPSSSSRSRAHRS